MDFKKGRGEWCLTAPTVETAVSLEKSKDIGKDGREAAEDDRQDPEPGQPLAHLEARVLVGDEVRAAGEEAGLEHAEEGAAERHGGPVLREAHADEDGAEADAEEGEPVCGAGAGEDEILGVSVGRELRQVFVIGGHTLGISKMLWLMLDESSSVRG